MNTLYRPDLLYADGRFISKTGLLVSDSGEILEISANRSAGRMVDLRGKALLPGFVNAHSHSFQRLIRGRAESKMTSGNDFWSWRGTMYHAANQLDPEDVYNVARMAFLEMVLAGATTVGEFHYLHNAPDGCPYEDPNLLSRQVIAAAQSVGLRIVLLRSAYLRSGFELPQDSGQRRFFESVRDFIENIGALRRQYQHSSEVHFGVAPHSIRAVAVRDLKEIAEWNSTAVLPLHMHVSEQVAENEACVREHGVTPVELLQREGILSSRFTAIHAIHITPAEIDMLASAKSKICACPTTERNLGDGIFPADRVMAAGISVALGSDSQTQVDPLEDARELDYHLRLELQKRAILDQIEGKTLPARLFESATIHGAASLGISSGQLTPGNVADFFTIDLNDLSIAGHSAEDLLPILVFSLNRSAIRDVVVDGKMILSDRKHPLQEEIVSNYNDVHQKVWTAARKVGGDR